MKRHQAQSDVDITYIISAYNRPWMLPVCLWSLIGQTHKSFEVIVTDNSTDKATAAKHKLYVEQVDDARFRYVNTAKHIEVSECYHSAEWAIKNLARGRWYCFPCDDTYLVPEFGQRMLAAAYANNWEFVVCGSVVVGPDASGGSGYRVWNMTIGRTVKTSFIVKASVYRGFEGKPSVPAPAAIDYFFGHRIRERGIAWGRVEEVMVVHN